MSKRVLQASQTAEVIRNSLKNEFPLVKWEVRSLMEIGVYISWTDGPVVEKVEKIVNKYQCGHYNKQKNRYEYSNIRDTVPQVKYLLTSRSMSKEIENEIMKYLQKNYKNCRGKSIDDWIPGFDGGNMRTMVWKVFKKRSY
jgi:hypothetical protein